MRTRKLYLFMLAVAAVLTACTNEDNFTNEQLPNTGNEARTFTVNIPASMGEGATTRAVTFNNDATPPTATGSFNASEKVYVYNETKKALLSGELRPTDISADGKSCNLTGTLTGSFDAGDKLNLLYNMNHFKADNAADCYFVYDYQNGSESGVIDGGMATGVNATISGSTLTTATTVTFAMQQAIFRLKFTDGTNPITVKTLIIESTGTDIASYYYPFADESSQYLEQSISVMPTTPTSDYLYVALGINESAEPSALTFTVTDDDGDVYTATKAAPTSGFKNGKYYYSSAATVLTWQTKLVKPTITWTSVADFTEKEPDELNWYYVYGPWNGEGYDPSEFTISGTSRGYRFYAFDGATIHLDNLDAIKNDENDFIYSTNYQLILDISGANTITCKTENQAIYSEGTLKLMGNGTLTVTAKSYTLYGLYADSNYKSGNNSDASVLAAPGFTVTRSDMTDNLDGTYTWTYTVTPAPSYTMAAAATTSDKGKLICTAGHIHVYGEDAACTAGRVAKIIYVGPTDATYNHGLALALEDMSTLLTWDNSGANNDGKTAAEWCSAWNTSKHVTDAEWLLASKNQWNYMLGTNGAGSSTTLLNGFTSVGGYNLESQDYWSSTEYESNTDEAWMFNFGYDWWYDTPKNRVYPLVRACLAF